MNRLDILVQKAIEKHGITEITRAIVPYRSFLTWKLVIESPRDFEHDRFVVWYRKETDQLVGYLSQEYSDTFLESMYGKKLDIVDQLLAELMKS